MSGFIKKNNTIKDTYPVKSEWGLLEGDLANQEDLSLELGGKEDNTNKENVTIDTSIDKYPTVNLLSTGLEGKSDTDHLHTGVYEELANKNENNGYAGLDEGGKIILSALPNTLLHYKGVWDADTNTPTLLATDVTKIGYVYNVSAAGTQFSIDWNLGDWAIYNDSGVIEKSDNSDDVVSVNGQQGVVELDTDDIPEGTTNLYVTTSEKSTWNSKEDVVNKENTIIDTSTTKYPTVNLLKTGLADKEDNLGNPSISGQVLASTTDGVRSWISAGTIETAESTLNKINEWPVEISPEEYPTAALVKTELDTLTETLASYETLPADQALAGTVTPTMVDKAYPLTTVKVARFEKATSQDIIFNWKSPTDADYENLLLKYRLYVSPTTHTGITRVNTAWQLKKLRAMEENILLIAFPENATLLITDADMEQDGLYKSDWSDPFVIEGMKQGDFIIFNLSRDVGLFADTYTGNVDISHLELFYTRGSAEPPPPPPPSPQIYFVDPAATGSNDGLTWTDAFTSLQTALATAALITGSSVWVKAGTYLPASPVTNASTFSIPESVLVYGGFAGTEENLIERDVIANETILDGAAVAWHTVTGNPDGTIDGFTIKRGSAWGTVGTINAVGGGIYCAAAAIDFSILNCIVTDNGSRSYGGGIYTEAPINIYNTKLVNNIAGVKGLGLYALNVAVDIVLNRCEVYNHVGAEAPVMFENSAALVKNSYVHDNNISGYCGGIYAVSGDKLVVVKNSTFRNNQVASSWLGIKGSALVMEAGASLDVLNCIAWGDTGKEQNIANWAGGGELRIGNTCYQATLTHTDLGGNIQIDPVYVSAADSRLQETSPCKNTGDNSYVEDLADLDGNPRIVGGTVDMGCYEYQ